MDKNGALVDAYWKIMTEIMREYWSLVEARVSKADLWSETAFKPEFRAGYREGLKAAQQYVREVLGEVGLGQS